MNPKQMFHKETGKRRVFFSTEELANDGANYQDTPPAIAPPVPLSLSKKELKKAEDSKE